MGLTKSDYLYATVAYADIFDYPLTKDDLYFRSIRYIPGKSSFFRIIKGTTRSDYLLCLKGRDAIIQIYERRRACSKKKWVIARYIANKIRIVPTVFLVGVTGGLAVNNASEQDDIDLFFICAKGSVWITRLIVTAIVNLSGKRRTPGSSNIRDSICLNMFIGDDSLMVPIQEQDLYAAHEVLQMEPIWSRRDTYRRFLRANDWVIDYLPVAWKIKQVGRNQHPKLSHWWTRLARKVLLFCEEPSKKIQLWYMKKRRSSEVITDSVLRFHPKDARVWIRRELSKRLKKRNIPLDKIFYAR